GVQNLGKIDLHTGILAKKGVPMPRLALLLALAFEIVGGASVALGVFPALGALLLIAFTLGASVLYHNFWVMQGEERASHLNSMFTNLALVGAFLLVIALSW
ncbi:MAG TPA: DoxX family protein, partial [Devosia sp.]|nr:DoxX family protein [Devosia sp.]